MEKEGGDDVKEHVYRIMNKLFAPELQNIVNRPGTFGKQKFHAYLENEIKGEPLSICNIYQLYHARTRTGFCNVTL